MSNPFIDINGKAITPGARVVISTTVGRYTKRRVFRKGVVYRTSVHLDVQGNAYGGTVSVEVEIPPAGPFMEKSRRWFRPAHMLVVG